jgi:uncharacterized protein (DUF736 family)
MADTDNKSNNEWEKRELGALWTKQAQGSGRKYFSGHIKIETDFGEEKKINVVAFHNKDKKSENSPDFRIYLSRPAGSNTESTATPQSQSQPQEETSEALL